MQSVTFVLLGLFSLTFGEEPIQLGQFKGLSNDVSGEIHATTDEAIIIKKFKYDGVAPDAFFYVGTEGEPSSDGILLQYPAGSKAPLDKFTGNEDEDIVLELPDDVKVTDLAWISVWCRDFEIDFGNMYFDQDAIAESEPEPETSTLA